MGVDYTAHLIYGVKMKGNFREWYDIAIEEAEGHPDAAFDLVVDNMMGEYAVAGKSISASDKFDEGFEILDDKIIMSFEEKEKIVKAVNEKLDTNFTPADFHYYSFVQAW